MSEGFPKAKRLLSPSQYHRVGKYGKTLYGELLVIQMCSSRHPLSKLGLTVSRKYGKATKRNRFKRLVREAFRLNHTSFPSHLHLNVRPGKGGVQPLTLHLVQQELLHLLVPACVPVPEKHR